ncbi:MAG TPA: hypothetical protein VMV50_03020 [Candidatus Paceibacterota bacterium]|nr:hypothetical protein [Candidatus Paceibacterota bacterium]
MSRIKALLLGIATIILIGVGGLVYRNAAEHPYQQIACPLDAKVCPDGTTLSRAGSECAFPTCPPPNVTLSAYGIAYAVPTGFTATALPDAASIAAYVSGAPSTSAAASSTLAATTSAEIIIRRYPLDASSTPLSVIQATAISGASGAPVPITSYSSTIIARQNFTIVPIERFEGVIDTAYYLTHGADVLRFDAIDRGVAAWTDPTLDTSTLPAQVALRQLLLTLQGSGTN